jgi:alpha-1,6-mannosyltransferase
MRRAPIASHQLICVSRLSREKRIDVAIRMLAVLRHRGVSAELTVVGGGPRLRALTALATGLPVRFTGHLSDRRALCTLLSSADLFVAPGPFETFGLAALEALACGTPVVAPSSSAVAELLIGAAGAVAANPGPAAMADAAQVALGYDDDMRRQAARAVAERFPWWSSVDGLLSLLHEAVLLARVPHRQSAQPRRRYQ